VGGRIRDMLTRCCFGARNSTEMIRSGSCIAFRGTREVHDYVDAVRFRLPAGTRGRLDHAVSSWRAVPYQRRTATPPSPGLPHESPARDDPSPADVAGLASLPNPVVARAAVPDALARQFSTRPSLPGATQPAVVPFRPRKVTTNSRLEINSAGTSTRDQQNRDIARKYEPQVLFR
jgi:hypothetical protein